MDVIYSKLSITVIKNPNKKVIFAGCSFTSGAGWHPSDKMIEIRNHPDLWVTLCHKNIPQLKDLDCVNAGQGGASNTEIFVNCVQSLATYAGDIVYLICQWTAMPRYNFRAGFELWPLQNEHLEIDHLEGGRGNHDLYLHNNSNIPRQYLDDLLDRLLVLHHLHGEISKLVRYTNILNILCKSMGIKIIHINGLCPWDDQYFTKLNNVLPEDYTPFTKEHILDIRNRDDDEILKLYNQAHDEYQNLGGIDPGQWVNLYSPFKNFIIDTNYDNRHPGIKSNQIYFSQVSDYFNQISQ